MSIKSAATKKRALKKLANLLMETKLLKKVTKVTDSPEPTIDEFLSSSDSEGVEIVPPSAQQIPTPSVSVSTPGNTANLPSPVSKNLIVHASEIETRTLTSRELIDFYTFPAMRRKGGAKSFFAYMHCKASSKTIKYLRENPPIFSNIPVRSVFEHHSALTNWVSLGVDVVTIPIPYDATNLSTGERTIFYRVPFASLPVKFKGPFTAVLREFLQVHQREQILYCPPVDISKFGF